MEDTGNSQPQRILSAKPRLVVGITSDQTCLVLRGRLKALRLAGFEVTLIASPGHLLTACAADEGVTACPIRMRRGIAPVADLISLFYLCRVLLRVKPQLTDFSTPKAGLLGNVAAWLVGVPHRVYTLRGLKLEGTTGWKRRVLLGAERLSAKFAERVLCNSDSLRAMALELGIAPGSKLVMLGSGSSNGVETERYAPGPNWMRHALGILPDEFVVGFVGRLTRDKGIPELLVAFEEILRFQPRCRLLLVGWFDDSEDRLDSEDRDWILEHPRIVYTGAIADTASYYRAMDLFVLPTHREGFPNVVLEAAASGLAVITTVTTGALDAVIHERTGILIQAKKPEEIVSAVLRMMGDDRQCKEFGETGRRWMQEEFRRERVLGLAVDFYQGLLQDDLSKVRDRERGAAI